MILLLQIEKLISCMRIDNEQDFKESNARIRKIPQQCCAPLMRENVAGATNYFKLIIAHPAERTSLIYEFLKAGEENAFSSEYLKTSLGFTNIRAVQKQIERERADGKVILSSTVPPGGYYRPRTALEIKQFIRTLENRGSKTLAALDGARKLLCEIENEKTEQI